MSPYLGLVIGLSDWRDNAVRTPSRVPDSLEIADLRSTAMHWGSLAGLSFDMFFAEVAWRYRTFPRPSLERDGQRVYGAAFAPERISINTRLLRVGLGLSF